MSNGAFAGKNRQNKKSQGMKKLYIVFAGILFFCFSEASFCYADKIYCKDGKVVYGTILCCTKGSIWVKHPSGSIGVNMDNIEKIENDDGTVSKFDYRFFYEMTQNYISEKKYSDAINMCSMLLKSFPDNPQIYYLRAVVNHKIGNTDQAIQDYNFLIENNFADANVFNNLGVIYAESREYKKAGDLFLKAIKLDKKNAEMHNNLAEALMQIKDYKTAIKEYDKVIDLDVGNIRAIYNSGIAYMKNMDYDKARERWKKVIAVNPDDVEAKSAIEHLNAIINNK
jgi:tetratricopeptide (TPR) repeat protein